MKKTLQLLPIIMMCLSLCACSGNTDSTISKKEYDKTAAKKDNTKEQKDNSEKQPDELNITQEPATDNTSPENNGEETAPHLSETDLNSQVKVKEYSYVNSIGFTWYFMEFTNNSPVTVSIETNVTAKDKKGKTIGAASESENAIESGYTVCLGHMFDSGKPEKFDYTFSVKEEDFFKPVLSDLSYETSDTEDKVIVSCTNKDTEPAEFVEGTILFFSGKKLLDHDTTYFTDKDLELKPGNTISEEFDYYGNKKYNKFKIYFTGNR